MKKAAKGCVALTHDGSRVAIALEQAFVIDTETGEELLRIDVDADRVMFSQDDETVITAGAAGIRIWSSTDGREVPTDPGTSADRWPYLVPRRLGIQLAPSSDETVFVDVRSGAACAWSPVRSVASASSADGAFWGLDAGETVEVVRVCEFSRDDH
jgi:hypothetical protein